MSIRLRRAPRDQRQWDADHPHSNPDAGQRVPPAEHLDQYDNSVHKETGKARPEEHESERAATHAAEPIRNRRADDQERSCAEPQSQEHISGIELHDILCERNEDEAYSTDDESGDEDFSRANPIDEETHNRPQDPRFGALDRNRRCHDRSAAACNRVCNRIHEG